MGAIKDIVDLTKDLESRAKERRDMDIIHKIQSLAFALQSQHADVVERDIRLMEENSELKRQVAEAQAEDIRFHGGLEFRRSKKTGDQWMPYCPTCHIPALTNPSIVENVLCSKCHWDSYVPVHSLSGIMSKL